MKRFSAYSSRGIEMAPVMAWATGQLDAAIELSLGVEARFDLRAESSAGVLEIVNGLSVLAPKLNRQRFTLGRWTEHRIKPILPTGSAAAFYWVLRYKSVEYTDGTYASQDYHHHRQLEKAIRL